MSIVFQNPSRLDDLDQKYHYCDACGHYNETAKRPTGGKFEPISGTDDEGNLYAADGPQGCAFCGSPAHRDGGRLGDMASIF